MGETRVDLLHLLEDLRDAYVGPVEETILTEIVANSLDAAGTSSASIRAAGVAGTATITASASISVGAGTGPASKA